MLKPNRLVQVQRRRHTAVGFQEEPGRARCACRLDDVLEKTPSNSLPLICRAHCHLRNLELAPRDGEERTAPDSFALDLCKEDASPFIENVGFGVGEGFHVLRLKLEISDDPLLVEPSKSIFIPPSKFSDKHVHGRSR